MNAWIRTSGTFADVIDFDEMLRDPAALEHLRAEYNSGDSLHPNDAGYAAMANGIDITGLPFRTCARTHLSSNPDAVERTTPVASTAPNLGVLDTPTPAGITEASASTEALAGTGLDTRPLGLAGAAAVGLTMLFRRVRRGHR